MAEHNEIGKIGENLAYTFLMKQGFTIIERNFRVRYGEIDIIVKKDNIIHFIEVKTVKVKSLTDLSSLIIRPEDNLTHEKYKNLLRTIELYKQGKGVSEEMPHQIDLACVYVDLEKREGKVKVLQNILRE